LRGFDQPKKIPCSVERALVFPYACRQFGGGFSMVKPGCFGMRSKVSSGGDRVGVEGDAVKNRWLQTGTHQEAQLTTDTETILSLVSFEMHHAFAARRHSWCSTIMSALRVAFHRSHRRVFFVGDSEGRRNNGVSVPAGDHFANASLDELW
jgi:hypothetical protein